MLLMCVAVGREGRRGGYFNLQADAVSADSHDNCISITKIPAVE